MLKSIFKNILIFALLLSSASALAWDEAHNSKRCYVDCLEMAQVMREMIIADAQELRVEVRQTSSELRESGNDKKDATLISNYFLGYMRVSARIARIEGLMDTVVKRPLTAKEEMTLLKLCHSGWSVADYAYDR